MCGACQGSRCIDSVERPLSTATAEVKRAERGHHQGVDMEGVGAVDDRDDKACKA